MKTLEIIGYKRANLGKLESRRLREGGNVPCVLYGGNEQVHFYSPLILFRELVYTNEAHFVHLNIEGQEYQSIMQEIQFHPVSENILHIDFLRIADDRKVKMEIPTRMMGQAPGVVKGGALVRKRSTLQVMGFPKDIPDHIDIDCSALDFHHAVKVRDIKMSNLTFLDPPQASIAVVEVPRSAKLATETSAVATDAAAPTASATDAKKAAPAADAKKAPAKKEGGKK